MKTSQQQTGFDNKQVKIVIWKCNHILYSKNFGCKKVWSIRTLGSLAEKLQQIEVCLHRECYANSEYW